MAGPHTFSGVPTPPARVMHTDTASVPHRIPSPVFPSPHSLRLPALAYPLYIVAFLAFFHATFPRQTDAPGSHHRPDAIRFHFQ